MNKEIIIDSHLSEESSIPQTRAGLKETNPTFWYSDNEIYWAVVISTISQVRESRRMRNRSVNGAISWSRTFYYWTLLFQQLNFPGRLIFWFKPLIFLSKLLLCQIQTFSWPKLMNLSLTESFIFQIPVRNKGTGHNVSFVNNYSEKYG